MCVFLFFFFNLFQYLLLIDDLSSKLSYILRRCKWIWIEAWIIIIIFFTRNN